MAKLTSGVSIANKKHGLKHNNNAIERHNGKIDDRIKISEGVLEVLKVQGVLWICKG